MSRNGGRNRAAWAIGVVLGCLLGAWAVSGWGGGGDGKEGGWKAQVEARREANEQVMELLGQARGRSKVDGRVH